LSIHVSLFSNSFKNKLISAQICLQIGMAKPAARRLLDIIKKKRRKAMVTKLLPGKFGTLTKKRSVPGTSSQYRTGPTSGPFALTW
jgi:hypothetical protein